MGFKEAFTRHGDGENLLFDDDAFYYFAISLLSIVILPLSYVLIKPIFNTFILGVNNNKFNRVPKGANDQLNMMLIKEQLRMKWLTAGYGFKVLLLLFLLVLLQASISQLPHADKIKGFDPYEILEIESTATEQEVKKAYRRISLKLHPDKNPDDPQASQKFIMLTKAYECLTDPEKKEVCLKFGNPDGQQSLSVGIAMPSFLLKKENRAAFLALIFLVLLVVVPVFVLNELKSIGKFDDNGVQLSNADRFERGLEENLLIRKCITLVSVTDEISKLAAKSHQEQYDLNKLAKDLIEEAEIRKIPNFEVTEAIEQTKKAKQNKRKIFISKGLLIIYAHLFNKAIPQSLQSSYREIITQIPKLTHSMVRYALQFSQKSTVLNLRSRGRIYTKFMGLKCITNLLQFSQCIVQGLHESDPPINQISFFQNEARNYIKRAKLPQFQDLIQKTESRTLPNWIPEEFKDKINQEIDMFPQLSVNYEILVDDDTITEQCIDDFVNLKITLTRTNTPVGQEIPFVHSNRFTYIREETWHVIVSFDDQICHYQKLNGAAREQISEFKFMPSMIFGDKCEFSLTLNVISDCYRGLDVEIPLKFNFKKGSQVDRKIEFHKEDQELDKSLPFIQSMLNPMQNQENLDDDSDSEEEEKENQKQ